MEARTTFNRATLMVDGEQTLQKGQAVFGTLFRNPNDVFIFSKDSPFPSGSRSRRICRSGKASLRMLATGQFRITMTVSPTDDLELLKDDRLFHMVERVYERMAEMLTEEKGGRL